MMYEIVTLTAAQLDALSAHHEQGGFQQTSAMMEVARSRVQAFDLVGVTCDGAVKAGCCIAYTRGHFGLEGSIWLGPLCDMGDGDLLAAMTEGIHRAARKRGAVSVTCWPDVVYMRRTSDGQPAGKPNDAAIASMRKLGWRHAGFTRGYGSVINRWVYVKDLDGLADDRALLRSYDKRTQWSVKRAQVMGVHIRELGIDELGVFAAIEDQTASRRHFESRNEAYFRQFKQAFGSRAHFMLAEIHIDEYIDEMTAKSEALQAKVAQLQSKYDQQPTTRTQRQLTEESNNLEAARKRLAEASQFAKDGTVLPAAASLFVEHPREMVYFFSGSVEKYKPFYASALIQHWAMSRCLELGVNRYNFYGISGVFDDPADPGRGVLEFKQGFNGYVEELIGEFTMPVSRLRFGVSELAHTLLHR